MASQRDFGLKRTRPRRRLRLFSFYPEPLNTQALPRTSAQRGWTVEGQTAFAASDLIGFARRDRRFWSRKGTKTQRGLSAVELIASLAVARGYNEWQARRP